MSATLIVQTSDLGVNLGEGVDSLTPLYWAIRKAASKQGVAVEPGQHMPAPKIFPPWFIYRFAVPDGLDLSLLQDDLRNEWSSYQIDPAENDIGLGQEVLGQGFPPLNDSTQLKIQDDEGNSV